jgi:hypothetical protein
MEPNGPSAHPAPSREQLPLAECLRLLASVQVGRIVYTRRALPAVDLVNFAIDAGDIVIRTDLGGTLVKAIQHAVVAFEADEVDAVTGQGWSVTAVGRSQEVTDPQDIVRLWDSGLWALAPGQLEHFIRVTPGIVHGRRLTRSRPAPLYGH